MKRVGVISDTHGSVSAEVQAFLQACDEVWHAGDVGNEPTLDAWMRFKPLTAVYGNIDDWRVRARLSEVAVFQCEDCKVMMTHIGGYPAHYAPGIAARLRQEKPDIFVAGHSHILKVMRDDTHGLMYFNPGAAGDSGFHKLKTALRFKIDGKRLYDLEVFEMPR
ncbi:MAG: metallophosphatase family protein [Bacteroidales bacterium]|nr:metallophosphatase family protein [Bacteroidales bacterium]